MTRRWIGALMLVVFVGAACGGASSGGAAGGAASWPEDAQEAALRFAECMREQGIDMPDPDVNEDGVMLVGPEGGADFNSEDMAEAHEACRHLLPEMQEPTEEERAELEDAMLEFAGCMRENGVEMPDPSDAGDGGGAIGIESAVDMDDPDFERAHETCSDVLPQPGGGS